ncbi:uncharacterized protein FTOL_13963 [Fusarium torulosum]|uniref:Uncharacterized protein n=1 Tax=Fusarium torulosum TaxID=33205 RepID=A0AAE8MN33_9HYPO|nr:uncharacterized protein FTOL_13963 [Fusarium torulosum]
MPFNPDLVTLGLSIPEQASREKDLELYSDFQQK